MFYVFRKLFKTKIFIGLEYFHKKKRFLGCFFIESWEESFFLRIRFHVFFSEKRKYLCPANKKNSMLATSSSLLIFLKQFVSKYPHQNLHSCQRFINCAQKKLTGCWRSRNKLNFPANLRQSKIDVVKLHYFSKK